MLKDWTLFEKIWLVLFSAVGLVLSYLWGDSALGFISMFTGMVCVVLVAKGKISNYYFGMIQVSTYAYLAYTYGLYGEAMLNGLFYFPMQFIGLYLWNRNRTKNDIQGEDVHVERLSAKGWVKTGVIVAVAIVAYGYFLQYLGGSSVWVDSATNVLSVTAMIFMVKRFAEQWLVWIGVNVLSIILWVTALAATGGQDYTMLVMWSAFLVNSVYGWYNWKKISEKQVAKARRSRDWEGKM